MINNTLIKNDLKLKQSYLLQPLCSCKNGEEIKSNEWHFNNFFDNYFCFCKGPLCQFQQIPQTCKYFFYLNIIDNYKDYYNKTEYLLGDFLYNGYSSDDSYPVFQEMINQNISAHYMTQNIDIYKRYCNKNEKCLKIIKVNNNEIINGDFLEKYLVLLLKLKTVISGAEFFFIDNLFYNIDYITYISLGHGVSFFKPFLYSNHSYYGNQIYNKILIPPSKILISLVKSYGWKEEDIIKINLPRWDKFNIQYEEQKNKSIFIMFTWRNLNKNQTISEHYLNNITSLINNYQLIQSLKKKKIAFYFTFHHSVSQNKTITKLNEYITYIEEKNISNILLKTDLIITDFSSIIFDFIYRRMPFINFIPDMTDSSIKIKYVKDYSQLIEDMKNNKIKIINKCFNVEEVINRINYYIDRNFKLKKEDIQFYDSFELKRGNNTIKFIEYLKNHLI